MKVVNFEEFCTVKEGTIFSRWEYETAVGLYRRGEVIYSGEKPIDFFEASIIASCWDAGIPAVDLTESRWAEFDPTQKFLIYDAVDLDLIIQALKGGSL